MVKKGAKEKYPPEKQRCMPFQQYIFETVYAKNNYDAGTWSTNGLTSNRTPQFVLTLSLLETEPHNLY